MNVLLNHTMNTCSTCRHWGLEGSSDISDLRRCQWETGANIYRPDRFEIGNTASSDFGSLCTGPEFGCIHHQHKD